MVGDVSEHHRKNEGDDNGSEEKNAWSGSTPCGSGKRVPTLGHQRVCGNGVKGGARVLGLINNRVSEAYADGQQKTVSRLIIQPDMEVPALTTKGRGRILCLFPYPPPSVKEILSRSLWNRRFLNFSEIYKGKKTFF